jgi:hypothetical protein
VRASRQHVTAYPSGLNEAELKPNKKTRKKRKKKEKKRRKKRRMVCSPNK